MAAMTLFVLVANIQCISAMQLYALSEKYHGTVPTSQGVYHTGNITSARCSLLCIGTNCTTFFYHPRLLECRLYNHRPFNLKLQDSEGWSTYHTQGEIRSWAIEVVNVSSQYSKTQWTAEKALGKPDLYPKYEDTDFAWAPLKKSSPHEWIQLGFEEKIYIREIRVYETYHAGAVSDVSGRRADHTWHTLWNTSRVQDIEHSRVFKPNLQKPYFKTSVIRITIDGRKCESWPEIDAVQIVGDYRAY